MINQLTDLELLQLNAEDNAQVPHFENEFISAKCFLQKGSNASGDNLYDHLTDVLNKILAERPENVVDFFEEYSRKVKERRFKNLSDRLEDIFVPPGKYQVATRLLPLLKPLAPGAPSTVDPEDLDLADMSRNNLLEQLFYYEHAGLGLPRTDMFCLTLSMRELIHAEPIANIRFWGKIFGLYKDYIILEAELKDEAYMKTEQEAAALENVDAIPPPPPSEQMPDNLQEQFDNIAKMQEIGGEEEPGIKLWDSLPPLPLNNYEAPPEPPSELPGVGLNKKVYYVCNQIGEKWIMLPDVTPKQIRVARQIYRQFTGDLDREIVTYPVFPGTERNLLRAQIARISASTHISPLGYYSFGGEDMGEEEELDEEVEVGGNKTEVKENPKYDPLPMKELTDKSMMFWVHHNPFILNQGRITWWNPNPLPETGLDEELGEEEEDEKPIVMGPEPETGPPLLTPCSEDVTLDAIPAWSVRCSSFGIAEEYAVAIVRSNFWPGAYCFTMHGKHFQNVYFGSGLKFLAPNFSPAPLPDVQQDYPIGPEIMEIIDPTGAEEEEWRIAHLPKEKPLKMPEAEEIEEEDEDEDEDEDDD